LAAPSWVRPGTLAENCAWLAGKVHEAGLLFLESRACLAYGDEDLPPWLSSLPLRWHVHLPLDLPWAAGAAGAGEAAGPERAAEICLALMDKLDFLGVRQAVLHPPLRALAGTGQADEAGETGEAGGPGRELCLRSLAVFTAAWRKAGRDTGDLLLENLPETVTLRDWRRLAEAARLFSCSFCFDFGHFLLHTGDAEARPEQKADRAVLDWLPAILRDTKLFHCCNAAHRALTRLSAPERAMCGEICRQARFCSPADAVFMLELFRWEDVEASLPLLRRWLEV
jgi:hypothetical protein